MPKPLKIVVWVAVFAACAGIGAFVASRSNPFPPGVEDPGAHPTPVQTSKPPAPTSWTLTMRISTQHTLHEGGACRSDWNVSGTIEIQPNGKTSGAADAKLTPPAGCDFAQSQILAGRDFTDADEGGRTPVGSSDLGGLTSTLRFIHPVVKLAPGAQAGHGATKVTRSDGDLGSYNSSTLLRVALQ